MGRHSQRVQKKERWNGWIAFRYMLVTVSKSRTAATNKLYLLGNNTWLAKARTTARVIHLSTAVPTTGGSMNLPVFISLFYGYMQADQNVQPLLKSAWVSATLTGIADL
jgi:hypothetical protein